jgi:hypothetical protein
MSVYRHARLNLLLAVYVDDFKMSGPASNLAEGWKLISQHIKLEKPSPLGRYLGCQHVTFQRTSPTNFNPNGSKPTLSELLFDKTELTNKASQTSSPSGSQGGRVTATFIKYDMRDFLEQCVEKYQSLSNNNVVLRKVETPFVDEAKDITLMGYKNLARVFAPNLYQPENIKYEMHMIRQTIDATEVLLHSQCWF